MAEEINEEGVEENLEDLPDDTDWKAKAEELSKKRTEDGIRSRERTKTLKEEHSTELDKLNKPKEPVKKEVKKEQEVKTDEFGLLELTFLRGEEVKSDDEVEFVREQLKELNLSKDQLPKLFSNKYFQSELETFRTEKVNKDATSDVKGGAGEGKAVNTPEYWIAKGVPPTREQVPDRKTRATIARAMMANTKSSKKYYSD